MDETIWTAGLPLELDYMLPAKPSDPEMRESASLWLFEEGGAFGFPRNGLEAVGKVWESHRFDCNFAFADGRVLRESSPGANFALEWGRTGVRMFWAPVRSCFAASNRSASGW